MKRILAAMRLTILSFLCVIPWAGSAQANDAVSCVARSLDGDTVVEEARFIEDYTPLSEVTPNEEGVFELTDGWYVLDQSMSVSQRIVVNSGEDVDSGVHLVLRDGMTLTANEEINVGPNEYLTL